MLIRLRRSARGAGARAVSAGSLRCNLVNAKLPPPRSPTRAVRSQNPMSGALVERKASLLRGHDGGFGRFGIIAVRIIEGEV